MARDPQRLAVLGIWALICMAALGLTALAASATRRLGRLAGGVVVTLALGWWVAEGYRPGLRPVVVAPPVDLRHVPPGAVVNVPLSVMDGLAMFLQVFHGRPIVTGYVSRASKSQFDHVSRWQELLERDARLFAAELRRQGVGTVVLEPGTADDVAASLMGSGLRVVDVRGWVPAPGQATSGSTGTRAERGPDLGSPARPSPAPTP